MKNQLIEIYYNSAKPESADVNAMLQAMLEQYEASMRDMSDYYNIIDTAAEEAEKRGLAKGMEIGRLEGRQEVRIETARKFKELGVDLQTIALATGLDVDIIEKL